MEQADTLIQAGKPDQAIELLEPLAERFKRDGDLQYYLGLAYVKAGDAWQGVICYRKALDLNRDPDLWIPLGYLYLILELRVLAQEALRRAIRHDPDHPLLQDTDEILSIIDDEIHVIADDLNLTMKAAGEGLRLMEEGQIVLQRGDYSRCIQINRAAIKILGSFPPPHNNLSLALFFSGRPQEAIQAARQVLENHPDNIQAMSNLIRFLAWTGNESEARQHWEHLRQQTPDLQDLRMKMLEAAAIIGDDQMVYRLAKDIAPVDPGDQRFASQVRFYQAVAEANLGMRSASRKLNRLVDEFPWADEFIQALKNGQTGLGWSQRFPYFRSGELLPKKEFEAFLELLTREESMSPGRFRREIERFAERFPQVVLIGKKIIIEDQQPEVGIQLLQTIGTPAAYAALREFGVSQIGSDEARRQAMFALLEAEQVQPGESLRMWQDGEWQEIALQRYEITDGAERSYSQQVADLLNRGLAAHKTGKLDQAQRLFLRALELEPGALEAYNNLGTIYAQRKDHERAKAMFRKAVEVDPHYVMACCNLASYVLDEEGPEAAQALLAPLADVQSFSTQSIVFLSYVRAQIALANEEFEEARKQLEFALEVDPDYEHAKELLQHLKLWQEMSSGFKAWGEREAKRRQSYRARMQRKLSTHNPTLGEALGIYTKELMTGMAREILLFGGWSTLKKAELHQSLVDGLQDGFVLEEIIAGLSQDELRALRQVLERGGHMPWKEFDRRFGNDLEESPYWQYHVPETIMGSLRLRGLLVEAEVDGEIILAIPIELREPLESLLAG